MVAMAGESGKRPGGALLLAVIALAWAGMVLGVSGLATPVKFQAASLTLPVALEVGRVTFHAFSRVEWAFAVLLVIAGALMGSHRLWLPIGVVAAIVLAQAVWLLPVLDARVAAVIAGEPLPPGAVHLLYVWAEVAKLTALLVLGIAVIRRT